MNLSSMTIEQLLEAQQPQLNKLYARQPLTEAENALYQQIIAEATRRHDALRQQELAERAERFAEYASQEDVEHARNGYGASQDTDARSRPLSWDEDEFTKSEHTCGMCDAKYWWSADDIAWRFEQSAFMPCGHPWDVLDKALDDEPLRNERGDRLE